MNSYSYFIAERLGREHMTEALREAERARLAKLAQEDDGRNSVQSEVRGKVMPSAAGAREMPGL